MRLSGNTALFTGGSIRIACAMAVTFLDAETRSQFAHSHRKYRGDSEASHSLAPLISDRLPQVKVLVSNTGV
jgi:short-subunit dehydrogenase involved in D-alanine esterification of teichoic acids